MTATLKELKNFYWYCHMAARIIGELPSNDATRNISQRAVRMATLNIAGKHGVRTASVGAHRIRQEGGKAWEKSGLVREHAVPVSEIHKRVVAAVKQQRSQSELADAAAQLDAEMLAAGLDRATIDELPPTPRAWHVARLVRELTHLCWVSRDDDQLLRAKPAGGGKSLHKSMPDDWDGVDPYARYRKCTIDVSPI